jgi:hypothetical protein
MYAIKEISRRTGKEKIIDQMENLSEAWTKMIQLNSKCEGFNGKGYGYGKEQGMRGVMFYVDGTDGVIYDVTNLDYTDFVMDYTKEKNLRR